MHTKDKNVKQQQKRPTWIFMREFAMILMCVYLGVSIMSERHCGRGSREGMDRRPSVFMHEGEVLQNR